jgi:hypothetical protein
MTAIEGVEGYPEISLQLKELREYQRQMLVAQAQLTQELRNTVDTLGRMVSRVEGYSERLLRLESRFEAIEKTEIKLTKGQQHKQAQWALWIAIGAMLSDWFPSLFRTIVKLLSNPN